MTNLSPAIAVFHRSHPGHEDEALRRALARYERIHGRPCHAPAAYFAAWPVAELRRLIKLPRVVCADCHGEGLVYDQPTDPRLDVIARKCHHARSAVA